MSVDGDALFYVWIVIGIFAGILIVRHFGRRR
jgi:hypothetical protein